MTCSECIFEGQTASVFRGCYEGDAGGRADHATRRVSCGRFPWSGTGRGARSVAPSPDRDSGLNALLEMWDVGDYLEDVTDRDRIEEWAISRL